MAGMRALGRVYDVCQNASGVAISLKNCSGIGLAVQNTATSSATLAFTASTTFAGSYNNVTTASGFGQPATWYTRASNTAAWTAQTASWSTNVLTIAATNGQQSYVDFLVSELADTYDYIKVTAGTGSTLTALLYDLTAQRTPANLVIPSA